MNRRQVLLAVAALTSAVAAHAPSPTPSIGSATMTSDGTIVLTLRAEGNKGEVGDAQVLYPKNHKDYQKILKHLGGLKPGQSKPVKPWPKS